MDSRCFMMRTSLGCWRAAVSLACMGQGTSDYAPECKQGVHLHSKLPQRQTRTAHKLQELAAAELCPRPAREQSSSSCAVPHHVLQLRMRSAEGLLGQAPFPRWGQALRQRMDPSIGDILLVLLSWQAAMHDCPDFVRVQRLPQPPYQFQQVRP